MSISCKVFCLFFLLIEIGFALICTRCLMNCTQPVKEKCLEGGINQNVGCLLETYTRDDDEKRILYTDRKCVIWEQQHFECVDHPGYTTLSCEICTSNLCNTAPSLQHTTNNNNL